MLLFCFGCETPNPLLTYFVIAATWVLTAWVLTAWVLAKKDLHPSSERFVILPKLVMASADPSPIIRDHFYSLDDILKRGRPPPLLKSAGKDIFIDGEPAPETAPVVDPA
ncbi:unnamed protein product [Prunus armeniaca]